MSRRRTVIVILVLCLAGGGLWYWRRAARKPAGAGPRAVAVQQGSIQDAVEATGSISPLNRVEVKPPIAGRIEKLLAAEGEKVQAGQVLAWMSSTDRAAILDAARAQGAEELKRWEDVYKPTPIVAPLSGVVILRNAVVGQTVEPGTVLFAMSDELIVLAQVDESDIGRVQVGMPVEIVLDAYPDQRVQGRVSDILHEGKNVSNVITYGVKVKPEAAPAFFRSQMTANVSFIIRRKDEALLVPASAVRETPDGHKQVLVPGPDGKPAPREVRTGIEGGGRIEIVEGLSAGDHVLLRQGRYVPQQGPQTSPLTLGGRPSGNQQGQAPGRRNRE